MPRIYYLLAVSLVTAAFAAAQDQAGQPAKGGGTVNEMSPSPDQNQVIVGQRPLSGTTGAVGGVPADEDRIGGKAFPASGSSGAGSGQTSSTSGSQGSVDPNTGTPTNDKAAVAAAKNKRAAPNNSPEANPPAGRVKNQTPSPGENAATRATTGGQTNEKPR